MNIERSRLIVRLEDPLCRLGGFSHKVSGIFFLASNLQPLTANSCPPRFELSVFSLEASQPLFVSFPIPPSDFRLPNSIFPIPPSAFRLPNSEFPLPLVLWDTFVPKINLRLSCNGFFIMIFRNYLSESWIILINRYIFMYRILIGWYLFRRDLSIETGR